MELRHLRHFVALAEELHFGRAARRLSMTQPPLSFSIRRLEEELEVRLFERDSKRVVLTAAGAVFLCEARRALDQARRAGELARSVAQGRSGTLDVGFAGSTLYRGVADAVAHFSAMNPDVEITLRELSTIEQLDALARDRIDLGFVNTNSVPAGLVGQILRDERFVCCIPEGHRLACAGAISLEQLAGEPFVMFAREVSPSNYDNVIAVCTAAGFNPVTRFAARQWLTVAAMVGNGLGVALVPESIARTCLAGARFVAIRDEHAPARAWCLWKPGRSAPALAGFVDAVRATVEERASKAGKLRSELLAVSRGIDEVNPGG